MAGACSIAGSDGHRHAPVQRVRGETSCRDREATALDRQPSAIAASAGRLSAASAQTVRRPTRCRIRTARSRYSGTLPQGAPGARPARWPSNPDGTSVWVAERCGEVLAGRRASTSRNRSDAAARASIRCSSSIRRRKLLRSCRAAGQLLFPHGHSRRPRRQRLGASTALAGVAKAIRCSSSAPTARRCCTLGRQACRAAGPTSSTRRPPSSPRPTATSSSPTATAETPTRASSSSPGIGDVHQDLGQEGLGPGELDIPHTIAMDSPGTPVRRRPSGQPHPDLRSGWQIPRSVGAVQPAERRLYRRQG